jgi:DNA-directed RNA polymerase subunit RPC12/RpoP
MAAWHLNCSKCNQRLARFNIEDGFENLFLPARPNFLKGGRQYECPNCGHKATYHQTDEFTTFQFYFVISMFEFCCCFPHGAFFFVSIVPIRGW